MLILLSTSFIVALNETPLRSYLMKPHFCVSYASADDYTASQYHYFNPHSPIERPFAKKRTPENAAPNCLTRHATKPLSCEQKTMKLPKNNYLQTLSVEDAQQEKRNRILRQKSSTETSGLGSSLDYTSTDELNNRSASNSRRHSSTSNAVLETKVVFSSKPSPIPISTRKVSWRTLPNSSVNSSQMSRGFSRPDTFTLETIESSGSSHANNDHSTPQSLNDFDHNTRVFKQYQHNKNKSSGYCEDFLPEVQETTVWKLRQEKKPKTYYNSELDFGTIIHSTDFENNPYYEPAEETQQDSKLECKRKSFQIKTVSSESEQMRWCNWSREKRSESGKRSDFCQLLQNTATKNTDYTELQSLIPKSSYTEMDRSVNNDTNNNPSTSQSSNPQSCTETMQISATYFAELSKKTSDKKRKDEENRLTHEQIHYLVEYWDHDTFVRLRTWALCFSLLAVGLQIFVGISSSWSFFGDEKYPNYSGLWVTCIPENNTCKYRIPFISEDNGYRDSILCLLTVSTIFSIGGTGLSFSGLCVTALARKLYYYHSAGEIFFVSGMTMALAVSLYSLTVELHIKFVKHRYGYTFWLAWFAAILLLLSAINLLMDELIQGSTKCRGCPCLAKCFRCCCVRSSQNSETESRIYVPPQQHISLRRVNSRKDPSKTHVGVSKDTILSSSTKLHNTTLETATIWRSENNDIEEDFV